MKAQAMHHEPPFMKRSVLSVRFDKSRALSPSWSALSFFLFAPWLPSTPDSMAGGCFKTRTKKDTTHDRIRKIGQERIV